MTKALLYLTVLIITISSCSLFEEPDELTIVNIGTDYFVELSQTLVPGKNALELRVTSLEQNTCDGSYIDINSQLTSNQIQLILGEIISPEPCAKTVNQLTSNIEYALTESNYDINISLKDIAQNHGHIMVTDDKFTIELETENGITIGQQTINIIPDGFVWGSISTNDIRQTQSMKSLLNELEISNHPHSLKDGNYSHFEIEDSNVDIKDIENQGTYYEYFLLKQQSTFHTIQTQLESFSEENQLIRISAFSSMGETFSF